MTGRAGQAGDKPFRKIVAALVLDCMNTLFGPSVEQNPSVWHQLIQEVEVTDVTG